MDWERLIENARWRDPVQCSKILRRRSLESYSKGKANWDPWIEHIRKRRNSIHAFRSQDLDTLDQWKKDLRMHLMFIRELDAQMPYPE